jgi:hypothetical protein
MPHQPVQYSRGGFGLTSVDRKVGKALVGIEAANTVAKRHDLARIERITETGEVGMLAAGRLGLVEAAVAQATPHVAPGLRVIQNACVLGIAGVVYDAGRGS